MYIYIYLENSTVYHTYIIKKTLSAVLENVGMGNIVKSHQVNFICIALNPSSSLKGLYRSYDYGSCDYDTPLAL